MAGLVENLYNVAALLPIDNPIATAPIFLACSAHLPPAARRQLARVVARNAFLLLVAAMLVGSHLLRFFGISIPIVRVAGGLVLLATGWKLLHAGDEPDAPPSTVTEASHGEATKRAFYPLTFPLTVGPGSISVAITVGAGAALDRPAGLMRVGAGIVGAALIAVAINVCYRSATRLMAALGETGTNVFLRLSAFILLCVGVSIFWSGLVGLVQSTKW
jgi:multiple antibiotic resistance protein